MSKIYNNTNNIANNLTDFFSEINLPLPDYRFDFLSNLIISLIESESGVISDITKKLNYSGVAEESIHRKIRRLFDSPKFQVYDIYDCIISYVIANYNIKHNDKVVHIVIDHSFCNDKFTTLMFTLRIGKQSIPLWFRSFEGISDPDAFATNLIIEGINYVYNLFKDKACYLRFLADRWFPNVVVLRHIDSLDCTYVFRTKSEHKVRYFDSKEGHHIWKHLSEFTHKKYTSKYLENVDYTTTNPIKTNIVLGKTNGTDDPWLLVTNGDCQSAVKDYSYRFGAIECYFKNTKTNGFYIESTKIQKLSAFEGMYLLVCIAVLWLIIIGSDYSKNKNNYCHKLNIRDTKKTKNGKIKRIISLFNLGLTVFDKLLNGVISIPIKCNFILYDV